MKHFGRFVSVISIISLICSLSISMPLVARADEPEDVENEEEVLVDERIIQMSPEDMPVVEYIEGASVCFDCKSVRIIEAVKYDLTAHTTVTPSYDDVIWTSMDPGVVTVDENGVLTGVSIGSAWVTAAVGQELARIYVYVDENTLVQDSNEYMYYIKVNRSFNCITIYTLDEAGEYTVPVRAFRCSTGRNTPYGTHKVRNHNAWNGLFGDYEGMWSSWIISEFLFHSVPFYYRSHDSLNISMYNEFGTTCSGGCVRLQVLNAKWIFDNCPVGTLVYFYFDDEDPGPLGLPEAIKLPGDVAWDPTDPDAANPWFEGEPVINGVHDISVSVGGEIDYFDGVTAIDSMGNDITDTLKVLTPVDVNTPGEYQVIYQVTDAAYKTVYAYCTVVVN